MYGLNTKIEFLLKLLDAGFLVMLAHYWKTASYQLFFSWFSCSVSLSAFMISSYSSLSRIHSRMYALLGCVPLATSMVFKRSNSMLSGTVNVLVPDMLICQHLILYVVWLTNRIANQTTYSI